MELFPMFLKIAGRSCLVVGAGAIAESKIDSLVRCGARVRVVAPAATQPIQDAAKAGTIVWEQREFLPADLDGAFLVVAATSSAKLHAEIYEQAQRRGILCNIVDVPELCDFYYPAALRRGPFQIAISTGGRAPSLSQRIRTELERQFGPEYGPWTEELGRARAELLTRNTSPEERLAALRELCSDRALQEFKRVNGLSRFGHPLENANGADGAEGAEVAEGAGAEEYER